MISEFGTVGSGGDVTEWYRQAFYHMDHTYRSGVRAVIFFNQPADLTMPSLQLNWSVTQSPKATALVTDELGRRSAL